jgi:hypothetical protein
MAAAAMDHVRLAELNEELRDLTAERSDAEAT